MKEMNAWNWNEDMQNNQWLNENSRCNAPLKKNYSADEKALKDFTDRNATTAMARPSQYLDWLKAAGFCHVGFFDGSGHLLPYFSAMFDVCHKQGGAMVKDGVPQPYLDKWIASLTDRVAIQKDKAVFAWGLFSACAPGPLFWVRFA